MPVALMVVGLVACLLAQFGLDAVVLVAFSATTGGWAGDTRLGAMLILMAALVIAVLADILIAVGSWLHSQKLASVAVTATHTQGEATA